MLLELVGINTLLTGLIVEEQALRLVPITRTRSSIERVIPIAYIKDPRVLRVIPGLGRVSKWNRPAGPFENKEPPRPEHQQKCKSFTGSRDHPGAAGLLGRNVSSDRTGASARPTRPLPIYDYRTPAGN